jgi:hypothetical protein
MLPTAVSETQSAVALPTESESVIAAANSAPATVEPVVVPQDSVASVEAKSIEPLVASTAEAEGSIVSVEPTSLTISPLPTAPSETQSLAVLWVTSEPAVAATNPAPSLVELVVAPQDIIASAEARSTEPMVASTVEPEESITVGSPANSASESAVAPVAAPSASTELLTKAEAESLCPISTAPPATIGGTQSAEVLPVNSEPVMMVSNSTLSADEQSAALQDIIALVEAKKTKPMADPTVKPEENIAQGEPTSAKPTTEPTTSKSVRKSVAREIRPASRLPALAHNPTSVVVNLLHDTSVATAASETRTRESQALRVPRSQQPAPGHYIDLVRTQADSVVDSSRFQLPRNGLVVFPSNELNDDVAIDVLALPLFSDSRPSELRQLQLRRHNSVHAR